MEGIAKLRGAGDEWIAQHERHPHRHRWRLAQVRIHNPLPRALDAFPDRPGQLGKSFAIELRVARVASQAENDLAAAYLAGGQKLPTAEALVADGLHDPSQGAQGATVGLVPVAALDLVEGAGVDADDSQRALCREALRDLGAHIPQREYEFQDGWSVVHGPPGVSRYWNSLGIVSCASIVENVAVWRMRGDYFPASPSSVRRAWACLS